MINPEAATPAEIVEVLSRATSVAEVCAELGVASSTVYLWAGDPELGGRAWRRADEAGRRRRAYLRRMGRRRPTVERELRAQSEPWILGYRRAPHG